MWGCCWCDDDQALNMSLISIFQQQQQQLWRRLEKHAMQERVTQEHSLAYLHFHEEEGKKDLSSVVIVLVIFSQKHFSTSCVDWWSRMRTSRQLIAGLFMTNDRRWTAAFLIVPSLFQFWSMMGLSMGGVVTARAGNVVTSKIYFTMSTFRKLQQLKDVVPSTCVCTYLFPK